MGSMENITTRFIISLLLIIFHTKKLSPKSKMGCTDSHSFHAVLWGSVLPESPSIKPGNRPLLGNQILAGVVSNDKVTGG